MPNAGYPEAREAIAKKVSKEHQFRVFAENVVMTVGAAGGLNVAIKTVADRGDEIIVIRPYFAEYLFYCDNHDVTMVPVDCAPDFSLDVSLIKRSLTKKTAAVIINSPNNPTGRVYGRKELFDVAELLAAHGAEYGRIPYVIADEPYRDIVYDHARVPPIMDICPESIVVSSFSKTLSVPGERIGYVAVNPKAADAARLVEGMIMCNRTLGYVNAPALMQRAIAEMGESTVDVSAYERRRNALSKILDAVGIEYAKPEGAFYFFCKAPGGDDVAFAMHLKDRGVLAVPGEGFGYPGWFRLSYCVSEATIEASAPMFKKAMSEWSAS
jgi:aspartate aminotransferase